MTELVSGIVEAVGQVVAEVEDDLRAAADDPRETDPLPECTNASVTEPDWAIPATPPRGRYGETSPMYVALFDVRSMTPMQFGPTSARPCSRAIRATSTCIAAAASPPSTTPPPGMMTAGHAGRGCRLGHRTRHATG